MKFDVVINHLKDFLPFFTDKFTDQLAVSSITQLNGLVTVITTINHGLQNDDKVVITGAKSGLSVNIGNSTIIDKKATLVTDVKHNLTKFFNYKTLLPDFPIVEVTGAPTEYNGEQVFIDVPNKNTVIIDYDVTLPALSGSPVIFDGVERGYNGCKQIIVVDPMTFTYPITGDPLDPFGTIVIHKKPRISGVISNERITEIYTKQDQQKYWLYVADNNNTMSKDRNILSDAVTNRYNGISFRSRIIDNVSLFVVAPSSDELAAVKVHDELEDVWIALIKTFAGFVINSLFATDEDFQVNYIGSELFGYNQAFVIKEYQFQTQYDITISDVFVNNNFVSLKQMNFDFENTMTATINLNEDGS